MTFELAPPSFPLAHGRTSMTTTSAVLPVLASGPRLVRAPRGPERTCKGWVQEAALRMLCNNLDPDVAEDPDHLVVYGGSGRAARSWEAFDAIVTSGDVTIGLMEEQTGDRVLHIGPGRDLSLFDAAEEATGWRPRLVALEDAQYALCTGLRNDESETPDDYEPELKAMAARAMTMICANPDIVIHRGETLIYCAGALARTSWRIRLGSRHALHPREGWQAYGVDRVVRLLSLAGNLRERFPLPRLGTL